MGEIEDNIAVSAAGPREEIEESEISSQVLTQLPSVRIGEIYDIFRYVAMHK